MNRAKTYSDLDPIARKAVDEMLGATESDTGRETAIEQAALDGFEIDYQSETRSYTFRLKIEVIDNGRLDCLHCGGSGEGATEYSVCRVCGGSGYALNERRGKR